MTFTDPPPRGERPRWPPTAAEASPVRHAAAARLLLEAWWLLSSGSGESSDVPSAADREAGWRDAVAGKVVEIGWLRRRGGRTARYETLSLDAVLAESEAPNAARS